MHIPVHTCGCKVKGNLFCFVFFFNVCYDFIDLFICEIHGDSNNVESYAFLFYHESFLPREEVLFV